MPVFWDGDVIVCGAGPAGVAAALASALSGAKTQLIELHGCLGGVWTSGLLSWIVDAHDKPGIMACLLDELDRRGARAHPGLAYDIEAMKLLLEQWCQAAGVQVRLLTRTVATYVQTSASNNKRLQLAITESKSGREAWRAKVFIDATGDGDLAALAGCQYAIGRPSDHKTQPMSLMALVTGIAISEVQPYVVGYADHRDAKQLLLNEITNAGGTPSYASPTLFRIRDDLFALMTNHEYNALATNASQISQATLHARSEINQIIYALQKRGGIWKNLRVVATAEQIGVREGRRIAGLYQVTINDLIAGVKHYDAVCRVTLNIDVHSPNPTESSDYTSDNKIKTKPYDIPLRALIARDVDGLLMAGRCISGDFLAHANYRLTGNAVAMGQAAGVTAALASRQECLPQQLEWNDIHEIIGKMSSLVDNIRTRTD